MSRPFKYSTPNKGLNLNFSLSRDVLGFDSGFRRLCHNNAAGKWSMTGMSRTLQHSTGGEGAESRERKTVNVGVIEDFLFTRNTIYSVG